MATYTVKQTGGDYSSLNAALAAVSTGDIVSIEGSWTVDDTTACVIQSGDDNITIQIGDSLAAHPGYWDTSQNHYRLVVSGAAAIGISGSGAVIDGLAIKQDGTGVSHEGIRVNNNGSNTIKNCLLTCGRNALDQDGIRFLHSVSPVVTVENCIIWDWTRRGIAFDQTAANTGYAYIEVNSCSIFNCGETNEGLGAGVGIMTLTTSPSSCKNLTCDIHNSIFMDNVVHANSGDVLLCNGTIRVAPTNMSVNVSYSVDSDGSIGSTGITSNTGNLNSYSLSDSTNPGAGNWVLVEDMTNTPYDFRLIDNASNGAQDVHTTSTAEGLSIPPTDIVGTTRPSGTYYDLGAFEIQAAITYNLSTTDVDSGSPTVGAPTIGQTHILSTGSVTSGGKVDDTGIGQTHILSTPGVESDTFVGTPEIHVIYSLETTGVESDPEVESPDFWVTYGLETTGVQSNPEMETPNFWQVHVFDTGDIVSTPEVDAVLMGSILETTDVNVGSPEVGSPTLGQTHTLSSNGVTSDPEVDTPRLGVIYIFETTDVVSAPPTVGSPELKKTHALSAIGVESTPTVDDTILSTPGGGILYSTMYTTWTGYSPWVSVDTEIVDIAKKFYIVDIAFTTLEV